MKRQPEPADTLRRVNDPPGSLRLPGGLAGYARGLRSDTLLEAHVLVEARARGVLAMLKSNPGHRVRPAVLIAQVIDHLAVTSRPVPDLVLVALAEALGVGIRSRRWFVGARGAEKSKSVLGVSDRTLRRIKAEGSLEPTDDPRWHAFEAVASGDLSDRALWDMLKALGLVQADPQGRKRGGSYALTRGAMEVLHGIVDPSAFIAASTAEAKSIRAQAKAAKVDRKTVRQWKDDPRSATAFQLNAMHADVWSKWNSVGGGVQRHLSPPESPLRTARKPARTKA